MSEKVKKLTVMVIFVTILKWKKLISSYLYEVYSIHILPLVQIFHVKKEVFVVSQYSIQDQIINKKIMKPTFSTAKNNRMGISIGFSESELVLHPH